MPQRLLRAIFIRVVKATSTPLAPLRSPQPMSLVQPNYAPGPHASALTVVSDLTPPVTPIIASNQTSYQSPQQNPQQHQPMPIITYTPHYFSQSQGTASPCLMGDSRAPFAYSAGRYPAHLPQRVTAQPDTLDSPCKLSTRFAHGSASHPQRPLHPLLSPWQPEDRALRAHTTPRRLPAARLRQRCCTDGSG